MFGVFLHYSTLESRINAQRDFLLPWFMLQVVLHLNHNDSIVITFVTENPAENFHMTKVQIQTNDFQHMKHKLKGLWDVAIATEHRNSDLQSAEKPVCCFSLEIATTHRANYFQQHVDVLVRSFSSSPHCSDQRKNLYLFLPCPRVPLTHSSCLNSFTVVAI